MLLILKRGSILFLALLAIVTFLIYTLYAPSAKQASAVLETIIVDPGHGAPDGGAAGGRTGVLEKDLNLAISKKLAEKLSSMGENVHLTREEDAGLHDAAGKSLREKKRSDMKKRVTLGNQNGTLCFVSIHMNHFTDPKYSGPQVFYAAENEEGKRLAEEIRKAFLEKIGPHCTRESKPSRDLYLLRNIKAPAVIVECGFLSNPEEEALLMTEDYQDSLAEAICAGIENFKKQA